MAQPVFDALAQGVGLFDDAPLAVVFGFELQAARRVAPFGQGVRVGGDARQACGDENKTPRHAGLFPARQFFVHYYFLAMSHHPIYIFQMKPESRQTIFLGFLEKIITHKYALSGVMRDAEDIHIRRQFGSVDRELI